jgi:hypothetical protein
MRQGNKKIYHLEAWVVKVMSLYKVCPIPLSAILVRSALVIYSATPQHFFYNIDMGAF